jgi:hypothetical protein
MAGKPNVVLKYTIVGHLHPDRHFTQATLVFAQNKLELLLMMGPELFVFDVEELLRQPVASVDMDAKVNSGQWNSQIALTKRVCFPHPQT